MHTKSIKMLSIALVFLFNFTEMRFENLWYFNGFYNFYVVFLFGFYMLFLFYNSLVPDIFNKFTMLEHMNI